MQPPGMLGRQAFCPCELKCLVQIEFQLGADGVGQFELAAGADAASFQVQVLVHLSFIQSRCGELSSSLAMAGAGAGAVEL